MGLEGIFFVSPHQAGLIARDLHLALAAGRIDTDAHAIATVLLFIIRRHGQATAIAAIATIARHVHLGRTKVKQSLARLCELGVFIRIKRRRRWAWGDSIASRQDSNAYAFRLPATEVAGRPVDQARKIIRELEAAQPGREAEPNLLALAERTWLGRYVRHKRR